MSGREDVRQLVMISAIVAPKCSRSWVGRGEVRRLSSAPTSAWKANAA
ncbi:hypothetical protein AB0M50_28470 [Nonomuraea fuscirosea]